MLDVILQACIKGGQPGTALEVFEQLTSKGGVRPDEVISTLVVQAYAMKGDFDQAFQAITVREKEGWGDESMFVGLGGGGGTHLLFALVGACLSHLAILARHSF